MLAFINNWKWIAAVIATGLVSYGLHSCDVARIEANQVKAIQAQEIALRAECKKDQQITAEVSNAYQYDLTGHGHQLSALDQLRPYCVPVTTGAAGGCHAASTGNKLPGRNGLSSKFLHEFAGRCEKTCLQLKEGQRFIRDVWKNKGQ